MIDVLNTSIQVQFYHKEKRTTKRDNCSEKFKRIPLIRVPTQTGKPEKIGRYFPVREKSGNFEQTGKVRENHTKYWKTHIISDKYYLLFLVIAKLTCVLFV